MIKYLITGLICFAAWAAAAQAPPHPAYHLIAHRGGVVDSLTPENSLASLQKAYAAGYWMVEIDMRATRDGQLVTNHDASLKKYYGVNRNISDMSWNEVAALKGSNGNSVMRLEDVFAYCQGKMQVMIDNKIRGDQPALFRRVVALLRKYRLNTEAMTIGTDESTEFFTGKVKLSCTRAQLEANMKRPDYDPSHYYLFGSDISADDVQWARTHHILAVAVVNAWTFKGDDRAAQARKACMQVQATGATCFQIDSEYREFFK